MHALKWLFAAALVGTALTANAAGNEGRDPNRRVERVSPAELSALLRDARTELDASRAPKRLSESETPSGSAPAKQSSPIANSYRAYPPSCIADPLPVPQGVNQITGRVYTANVAFDAYDRVNRRYDRESVTVLIWRLPCSGGDSVTLVTFRRSAQREGNANIYPLFPEFRLSQGGNTDKLVRTAEEPNTVITNQAVDTPFVYSTTLLLENFPFNNTSTAYWDFNLPFRLTMVFQDNSAADLSALDPYRPSEYPDAALPLPINGYMSGNWTDPAHVGEGINLEIGEVVGSQSRYLFFAWFTYDELGLPYWISGGGALSNANATTPTRSVIAPAIYRTGGGFAGNFGADTQRGNWGDVEFKFIDCNTMRMDWRSNAGLPASTPGRGPNASGTAGTRTWKRGSTINGLTCDMPPVN